MKAVVVYESMFGNTRRIAEAVGAGLAPRYDVALRPVGEVTPEDVRAADLLVLGAPTHTWGLSRPSTRQSAAAQAEQPDSGITLELAATGAGMREWLAGIRAGRARIAVFDTRMQAPRIVTGSAGAKIARRLRRQGCHLVGRPRSFLVTRASVLAEGELEHARLWGEQVAASTPVPVPVP